MNKTQFIESGFKVYRDLEKPNNRGYVLINIENRLKLDNLSVFDVFDYLRSEKTQFLYNYLRSDKIEFLYSFKFNNNDQLKLYMIEKNKIFYDEFKELINKEKTFICGYTFKPVDDLEIKENNLIKINLYTKNSKFKDLKPNIKAQFPLIERLLKNICGSNEAYEFFIKFLSYKLKNPLDRIPCHFIIQDNGGTGKSEILFSIILSNLFEFKPISQDDLKSSYLGYIQGVNFLGVEEIEGYEDEKKIKLITGSETITSRNPYERAVTSKNYTSIIINSNDIKTLKMAEDDRRFNVIGGGKRIIPLAQEPDNWKITIFDNKKEKIEFFKKFHKNKNKELKNMYSYLLALDIQRNEIEVPMWTIQKEELININKSSEKLFIDEIIETQLDYNILSKNIFKHSDNKYYIPIKHFYDSYIKFCKEEGYKNNLSKNVFIKKLSNYKPYNKYFNGKKLIKVDNEPLKCIEIKLKGV